MRDLAFSDTDRPAAPTGGGTATVPGDGADVAQLLERLPVGEENRQVLARALAGCPELAEPDLPF